VGSLDYLYQVVWVLVPASLVVKEVVVVLVMVVGVGVLTHRRRRLRRRTLDFILHNRFNVFNNASLTRTIHDRFDRFFRMNWFPTEVRVKLAD
jgi:hypothetical protein